MLMFSRTLSLGTEKSTRSIYDLCHAVTGHSENDSASTARKFVPQQTHKTVEKGKRVYGGEVKGRK